MVQTRKMTKHLRGSDQTAGNYLQPRSVKRLSFLLIPFQIKGPIAMIFQACKLVVNDAAGSCREINAYHGDINEPHIFALQKLDCSVV